MAKKGSSKLNIAIIHPDLGIGGAERLIVDAAVELASHGHNVHVFTAHHDKNRCFEETISGTFPVTVYGAFLPRHIFYHLHALCAYLQCLFVALCMLVMWPSFDVILADQVSIVIPLLKLKKSTKVLFYCHFPDLLLAQHTTILRRIYRKPIDFIEEMTTGIADKILVNSKFTESMFAKTFKRLDAQGVRPAVLYPAVNVNQFDEPTNSYKLNFLSINRFEKKKNIDLAILAFSMLRTLGGDVLQDLNLAEASLTIAGGFDKRLKENVEYLEELRSLAEREGVSSQVNFITSCSTAERNALLSQCLCVLYTPKDEHFGIVPLEAMAAHKPVIACNSGGPVETVKNGVTGFLCEGNSREFSLAMAKLIQDPQMAQRMGTEARKHVTESFSTKIFGQNLNQYLVDVARTKRD
ncbi:alpha-1 3/1 6-mannosyltransferase ALG2-like [Prunus yedoensis var. nudiflora]|uniref:Alpha-1,3/1,6-mannosyltransferase ALG2 n=1 Tax=Prunus yedoensis var. nudiflora TaxID=2094558 RepID=A0A314ZPV8_PRUYE|nr:alpha-1 3/1 6-mannosyltransferase ALG2-like [Prunus yedoensis var. nudiflora]